MTSPTPQYTDFSKDVLGRYVCNGLDEALASTTGRPDARPFDIVVVGGGSFGSALAQHVLDRDTFRNHRILVLEAGPFVFPEHVQNLPMVGVVAPPPVTVDPGVPRAEVWGLPWRSNVADGFPGLAYCPGGRSLFWGGWSPQLLEAETPAGQWPANVLGDLRTRVLDGEVGGYFHQAARQIGVTETNDFIFGAMHEALRQQLFDGLQANAVPNAIPLAQLPLFLDPDPAWTPADREQRKLEAPLAVQGRGPRSGFFPLNKFSGMPLLMKAARQAWTDSGGDDVRKRLMVVPNCHVTRLETTVDSGVGQVRVVHTNLGPIPVPDRGVVVLAAGTIESTRLALLSFQGTLGYGLIGTNLMAHMRSNYAFRVPRQALQHLGSAVQDLQESALFVKGRKPHADGSASHFHLQITAAGLHAPGGNSEVELFQAIPDIDLLDQFRAIADDRVVITLRGVGEMQPQNPASRITLSGELDEFGVQRAFVQLGDPRSPATPADTQQTVNDRDLWQAMDNAADAVRDVIANGQPIEEVSPRVRDGMGSTHHESGSLWMGEHPTGSVTTANARFHHVVNAYAIGPALLPTMGSPNPMLSGVALARRLGEHLVAPLAPPPLENGFAWLFDGTQTSFANWAQAGPSSFQLVAGEQVLTAQPGNDIGLLYYTAQQFGDFILRLQMRIDGRGDNSGVFLRSFDPTQPPPTLNDPRAAANPAFVAVDTGFEVQIDDLARPDDLDKHRTGAIYDVDVGQAAGQQDYRRGSALQPGEWNDLEIEAQGDAYTVRLNGYQTSTFTNKDPNRGLPAQTDSHSGFIGLQEHTGRVSFRAIRIKQLP